MLSLARGKGVEATRVPVTSTPDSANLWPSTLSLPLKGFEYVVEDLDQGFNAQASLRVTAH